MRDRGGDTSHALTEVRTVLSRAQTARQALAYPTERALAPDGKPDYGSALIEDEDAALMRAALDMAIELLAPWERTRRPRR